MTGCSSLSTLARALGGDVVGHQVNCPGPNHSPRDRSLSVRLSPSAPEGFVVHSHCGDDPFACRDHVRSKMGWARPARFGRDDGAEGDVETSPSRRDDPSSDDDAAKIARARAIWHEAIDPRGSIVEVYLNSRGLDLPWQVAGETLRYHSRCPWRDEATGQTIRVPAMVAAMRSMVSEQITGVHRTRLTADGRKVDRRMLGKASGAAIMLCPMSALGGGLTVAEGVETALAAWQIGWPNMCAMGSVGAIERLPALPFFDAITLMAETGDSGASERAIAAVSARWHEAGREVIVVTPTIGGDINDTIRSAAA